MIRGSTSTTPTPIRTFGANGDAVGNPVSLRSLGERPPDRDGGSPLPDEDTLTNGLYAMDPDGTNIAALTPSDEFSIRWYTWTVAP